MNTLTHTQTYTELFEAVYKLHDYQIENIYKLMSGLQTKNRVLLQQPTGTGKSVEIAYIICRSLDVNKRVMVVVPNDDLINNILKYSSQFNIRTGIIQANKKTDWYAPLIIASAATLHRRLKLFPKLPDLILWDEVHHIKADTWQKSANHFKDQKNIGFTATPTRLDGRGFNDFFEDIVTSHSLRWFIDNGYLCDYRYLTAPHIALDFSIKGSNDRLKDQDAVYNNAECIGDLLEHWIKYAYGMPTLIYATTIEHSRNIVKRYNEYTYINTGYERFVHLDGEIKKSNYSYYQQCLKDFETGKLWGVSNVNLFMEGIDFPALSCVQFARKTASFSRYMQMIGRGLRIDRTNPNKVCIFLDHVGLIEHGKPDDQISWSLKGLEKQSDYYYHCNGCDHLISDDYRQLLNDNPLGYVTCEECGNINYLPIKEKKNTEKGINKRENPTEDEDTELIEVNIDSITIRINKFLHLRQQYEHKKFSVVIKILQMKNVTYKHFQYACKYLEYNPGYAARLFKNYKIITDTEKSDEDIKKMLLSNGVGDMIDLYMKIRNEYHSDL